MVSIFFDRRGGDRIHPSELQLAVTPDRPLFVTVTKKVTENALQEADPKTVAVQCGWRGLL